LRGGETQKNKRMNRGKEIASAKTPQCEDAPCAMRHETKTP